MNRLRFLRVLNPNVFVTVAVLAAALVLGQLVVLYNFGIREFVILILVILTSMLVLVPNDRILRYGFILWILTFGFGWRTLYLTPNLNIHPAEVLGLLLCLAIIARATIKHTPLDFSLPVLIPFFLIFAVMGILTALGNGRALDVVLEEFKVYVAIIPSYFVVKWMVRDRQDWERAAQLGALIALYVSLLGFMDYFAPGLSHALAGSQSIETIYAATNYASDTFNRVGFIFYGSFLAGFLIFTFWGISIYHFLKSFRNGKMRMLGWSFVVLVEAGAMYLSGYRGLWYSTGVLLLLYGLLNRRSWVVIGGVLFALPLLPVDFFTRFQSLFNTQFADSSQYDRIQRAQYALSLIAQSPLIGVGWGGSGYVHSDLAQLGANLGIPALGVFLSWIASLLWKLFRLALRSDWIRDYAQALFVTIGGLIVVLFGEGLTAFVQVMIPIWFLFAMAYKLFEFSKSESAPGAKYSNEQI